MDPITGVSGVLTWWEWMTVWWEWMKVVCTAVTAAVTFTYTLPGKWNFLVAMDLQYRNFFGYSMACKC